MTSQYSIRGSNGGTRLAKKLVCAICRASLLGGSLRARRRALGALVRAPGRCRTPFTTESRFGWQTDGQVRLGAHTETAASVGSQVLGAKCWVPSVGFSKIHGNISTPPFEGVSAPIRTAQIGRQMGVTARQLGVGVLPRWLRLLLGEVHRGAPPSTQLQHSQAVSQPPRKAPCNIRKGFEPPESPPPASPESNTSKHGARERREERAQG